MTGLSQGGKDTYRTIESVRMAFFRGLELRLGETRFQKYWEDTLWATRTRVPREAAFIYFTVPQEFFTERMRVATEVGLGSSIRFLMGLPRRQLLDLSDENFNETMDRFTRAAKAGWANGLDISGSLQEADSTDGPPAALKLQTEEKRKEAARATTRASVLRQQGDNAGADREFKL